MPSPPTQEELECLGNRVHPACPRLGISKCQSDCRTYERTLQECNFKCTHAALQEQSGSTKATRLTEQL